ncbi:MAG: PriCT-2 domain-containing protein, partial [Candidatus Cloacimonetes bacterium]|nr:PriCT-2 domain-containing protein [Candidatus Cloacimonadota bacterium]
MEQTQINPLNLITFGKSITRPEAIETMPAVNLMAMLQNGQWRKPIEAIRKEKNPILQKEMKLRLPYFVYGVLEGARSEGNVRQVNGIVFDFDHVGEIIPAKQKLMGAAPWFRWLFRSPVDGLKLMIPFSRPVTDKAEYLMIWNLLKAEIEAKSGFQADNTPDLCRACFLSWDDDVIFAPDDFQMDLDFYLNDSEQIRLREADKKKRDRKTETQRDREQKENGERAGANIGNAGPKQYGTPVLTGRTAGFIRCGDDCGPAVTRDGNDSQMNLADRPDESGVPIPRQPDTRKRKVDVLVNQITGATDVPVGQGPEGLSGPKDKPLRGFANGDVCGSCNAADVCGSTITLDEVQAKSAVEYLAQRKLDRREWIRCGIALYNHFGEDGIVYWLQFAYNPNYSDTPEDLRKVWERLKKYPGVNIGTLFYIAEQNGWINAVGGEGFPGMRADAVGEEKEGKREIVGANLGNAGPQQYGTPVLTGRTAGFIRCGDDCGPAVTGDGNESQMNLADRPDESGVPIPRQPGARKRKVDVLVNQITGATDVPVGQGPEGLSGPKDKPLRGFANGDVCGSCNAADVCGSTITLDEVQAKSAVEYLAQRKLDRREWIRCGIALYNHFGEDGIVYWLQFAYNPNYSDTPEDLRKVWERLKKYPGVNIGTLFYIAEQNGWINAVGGEGFPGMRADAVGEEKEGKREIVGANLGNAGPKQYGTPVLTGRTAGFIRCGDDCGPAVTRDGNESQMNLADRPDESGVPIPRQPDTRKRKVDVPVDQKPAGLCGKAKGSLLRSEVDGDVNLPKPTLADFPELLDLFRRPQNIHLDRDQLPREIVGYLDLVGRITDAQDGAKLTAFLPVVAAN